MNMCMQICLILLRPPNVRNSSNREQYIAVMERFVNYVWTWEHTAFETSAMELHHLDDGVGVSWPKRWICQTQRIDVVGVSSSTWASLVGDIRSGNVIAIVSICMHFVHGLVWLELSDDKARISLFIIYSLNDPYVYSDMSQTYTWNQS